MNLKCVEDVMVNGIVVYTKGEIYEANELNENELEIAGNFGTGVWSSDEPKFAKHFKETNVKKWLTTGEMLDQLQVGEVAEGNSYWEVKKLEDGRIVEANSGDTFGMNSDFLNEKWKIIKYLSFEEAMIRLKNGEELILHLNEEDKPEKTIFRNWYHLSSRDDITFNDLFDGKWTLNN